jgi:integrating conjugative element protein (TIGR03761 family)
MIRLEEKISATQGGLSRLKAQVDAVLRSVPPALNFGENLNVQPVKVPLYVGSQLGFLAVYLLAAYDELARRTMLAHHVALIDRSTYGDWLEEGAHLLRSTFTLAQQYRFSGTTRDDHAANNAAARIAQEKYGQVPQDILEGTRRSRFAPPVLRGRDPSADPSAPEPEPPPALEDATQGAEDTAL